MDTSNGGKDSDSVESRLPLEIWEESRGQRLALKGLFIPLLSVSRRITGKKPELLV